MSNAAKHRKKAAEFEQLKQIDRAIASYIKAIDESEASGEEVDVALLNKVGDLTLRQGRVPDAVTYYERAVEHYASNGLFNNAIALCNKILRSSPGRAKVYFTLGRICAKKGLRGDATRNFLEYATRMQQEGRVDEGMRALAEVADLMPELIEVRRLVEEHAERAGITLDRRKTPAAVVAQQADPMFPNRINKSSELVFLDTADPDLVRRLTPPLAPVIPTPRKSLAAQAEAPRRGPTPAPPATPKAANGTTANGKSSSIDSFLLFDPSRPGAVTPPNMIKAVSATPADAIVASLPADTAVPSSIEHADASAEGATPIEPSMVDATGEAISVPMSEAPAEADGVVADAIDEALELTIEAPADEEPTLDMNALDAMLNALESSVAEEAALEAQSVESTGDASADTASLVGHDAAIADADAQHDNQIAMSDLTSWDSGESVSEQQPDDEADAPVNLEYILDERLLDDEPSEEMRAVDLVIDDALSVEGLEANGEFGGETVPMLEFLETDDERTSASFDAAIIDVDLVDAPVAEREDTGALEAEENVGLHALTWLTPAASASPIEDSEPASIIATDLVLSEEAVAEQQAPIVVETLPDLVIEDFDRVADDSDTMLVSGGVSGTPAYGSQTPRSLTPLDVSRIPEIEEAIEAGALAAARADADPEIVLQRPPYRFDPHNFILPGELPALELTDEEMERLAHEEAASMARAESGADDLGALVTPTVSSAVGQIVEAAGAIPTPLSMTPLSVTPSIPTAAIAAEAKLVATSRREELMAAVAQAPTDFSLRRRLAEALFDAGDREGGLGELQASLSGYAQQGNLQAAAEIADELVRTSPERIPYHQKRVELAVRLSDQGRLRAAYLDLGDTLIRMGDDIRAHAVYARVLELDPWDERARAALGAAAPPPPPKPTSDESFVDLAEWLRDDEPGSTRMRMRAPEVSGDEQADFESLLRHFKEGVARSLEEEDYESHYDLGVAYKEMGLLDDAIAEFQKALRSRRHRLPAYEALGQCFVEQSRHSVAATVLTRALHEPGLGDEQRVGVLYLLAYSCEALQRWDEARSYYSRVYATDINFRDAAARLAALEQIAQ